MITAAVMRARCVFFCPRRFGVCEICFGDLLLLLFFFNLYFISEQAALILKSQPLLTS